MTEQQITAALSCEHKLDKLRNLARRPPTSAPEEKWQDYLGELHDLLQWIVYEIGDASGFIRQKQIFEAMQKQIGQTIFPPEQ